MNIKNSDVIHVLQGNIIEMADDAWEKTDWNAN